jgi:DNA-binding SARP family transcriptional activator
MAALIRVLGPVEVIFEGRPVPVVGRKKRTVLAALVLAVDHAVPVDHLVAAVWGDDPPPSSRATLQGYISDLRRMLGRDLIEYEEDAYVLRLSPDAVDQVQFERLVVEAADLLDSDAGRARALCMEALSLWQGPPFGDLGDEEFVSLEAQRLEELRLRAMELRLEADIALGRDADAAAILSGAVHEYPYRERLWFLLMTALAHDGRRVEALRAYQQLVDLLIEVGLEPSRDMKELEQQILVEAPNLRAHLAGANRPDVPTGGAEA